MDLERYFELCGVLQRWRLDPDGYRRHIGLVPQ